MLPVINIKDPAYGAVGDGIADDTLAIQNAIDAAAVLMDPTKTVVIPTGIYRVTSTIHHRVGVKVRGVGSDSSIILQSDDVSPVWDFEPNPPDPTIDTHGELSDVRIVGQPSQIPETEPNYEVLLANSRVGVGVSLVESRNVTMRDVSIWDFEIGVDLSDGNPSVPGAYSGYNVLGPQLEVSRCSTGIRALANANSAMLFGSRVFYSFTTQSDGVGIDVGSASSLTLIGNAIESADCCLRIRDTDQNLRVLVAANYLEPGKNKLVDPNTEGLAYDIVVDNLSSNLGNNDPRVVQGFANMVSANNMHAALRPSSIHHWDGPSAGPFGARYAGVAAPKRNLCRNGGFGYYNANLIPDWTPTAVNLSENVSDFVTGVRSVLVHAANNVAANLTHKFDITDPGVEWITVGVRYKVLSGAGFSVSAVAGGNAAQRPDPVVDGQWKDMHITVRRPTNSTQGQVVIYPDLEAGTGRCLIDEVWAVAGRYAVDSTQYGERIELLPAPLEIAGGAVNQSTTWGPVDILDLPTTLNAPLDDFATAPMGVCGGVFRLQLKIPGAVNPLPSHNWLSIDAPAAGAVIAANKARVTALYADQPVEGDFLVRTTAPSGEINRANPNPQGTFSVSLVAWVLR